LEDSSPEVRDAAAVTFGTLVGIVGERSMQPYLSKLDKIKLAKVKEHVPQIQQPAPTAAPVAIDDLSDESDKPKEEKKLEKKPPAKKPGKSDEAEPAKEPAKPKPTKAAPAKVFFSQAVVNLTFIGST
jgi:cytoskeleton-associated protein 5